MKHIDWYARGEPEYDAAALFAQRIYREKLKFNLEKFPDYFFAITEDGRTLGCIGLNNTLHCSLFLRSGTIVTYCGKQERSGRRVSEQSILAVESCPFGTALLIALLLECAYYIGIDEIIFAGTPIALHTIRSMGAELCELMPADREALLPEEARDYEFWFAHNVPWICTVPTTQMPDISKRICEERREVVTIGAKITRMRAHGRMY